MVVSFAEFLKCRLFIQIYFWFLADENTQLQAMAKLCDLSQFYYSKDCSSLKLIFLEHKKALLFIDTKNIVRYFDLNLNQILSGMDFQIKPHSRILLTPEDGFLTAMSTDVCSFS